MKIQEIVNSRIVNSKIPQSEHFLQQPCTLHKIFSLSLCYWILLEQFWFKLIDLGKFYFKNFKRSGEKTEKGLLR